MSTKHGKRHSKRRPQPHERVLTPNQAATLEHLRGSVEQANALRAAQQKQLAQARLDRFVLAIASGWYGVSDSRPTVGPNDYPENPRATPELTNAAIVEAALDLMKQADEAAEELLANPSVGSPAPAPAAAPAVDPSPTPQDGAADASTPVQGGALATVVGAYGRVVPVISDAPQQSAS